jgi:thiamine kinase
MLAWVEGLLQRLEKLYGVSLVPLGQGSEARTYRGGAWVFKVYAPQEAELPFREIANMHRAGLATWVREVRQIDGYSVLVLRYFPGRPFRAETFDSEVLSALKEVFPRLHSLAEAGRSRAQLLDERLERFQVALPAIRPLAERLKEHLTEVDGVPLVFCHNDPWAGNLLVREEDLPEIPRVLLVDWARAGGEDPARDLAILKTGTLDLLGELRAREVLCEIVRSYPEPQPLWRRLRFFVPLTYLHDLYWFSTKHPGELPKIFEEKLGRAWSFYEEFSTLAC